MPYIRVLLDVFVAYGIYLIDSLAGQSDGSFLIFLKIALFACVTVHAVAQLLSDRAGLWRIRCRNAGWTVGLLTASVLTLHDYQQISTDSNSTAGIGLIFLPFSFAIFLAYSYYLGWTLSFIKTWFQREHKAMRPLAFGLIALFALTIIAGGIEAVGSYRENVLIGKVASMQSTELHALMQDQWAIKKRWVLNAVACNERASKEDLLLIAKLPDPQLHERGRPQVVSDACNHKGLAVMRLVAYHPNVDVETLELLSHSQNEYVLSSVIENEKTPQAAIDRIKSAAEIDSVVKSALDQRASEKAAENRAKDATLRKTPGSPLFVAAKNPDADFSERGLVKLLNQAIGPAQLGCRSGQRAALLDVGKFRNIAACSAHWRAASMWAKKTGRSCGKSVACDVPADACAIGWHICGVSPQGVAELRNLLSSEQCAGLPGARFLAALNETDCGGCASSDRHGAICCGRDCSRNRNDCVWQGATAWAETRGGLNNSCGEIEMFDDGKSGVLCCSDIGDHTQSSLQPKQREH